MAHNVLLITGGQIAYHDYAKSAEVLAAALKAQGINVTATHDPAAATNLSKYDALVLFTDGDYFQDGQIESIIQFVHAGKGLVSLHTAAGTNKSHDGFSKLIGSRINGGAIFPHKVTVEAPDHPILHRVLDFRLDDEIHDLEMIGESHTLLSAWLNGKKQPLAYAKPAGAGKLIHFATGHSIAGLTHPQWQKIFVRAVRFVCGEDWSTKTLKCACIGYGGAFNMGKRHMEGCRIARMVPVAVCDVDPKRTETAKAELGDQIQTYSSVADLLDQSDAEMITVITPHNTHAALSMQVINSGRHVVTEKPYTITVDEATQVIQTARKAGKMATVFHNRRWDGDFQTIRALVESGVIGDVFHIECAFGGYNEPRANWWRSSKSVSGGAFYDWGAHFADWILQLMPHKIESISGDFKKLKWHGVDIEDYTSAHIRFAGQRSASLEQGSINAIPKSRWRILGTLGGIEKPTGDAIPKDKVRLVSYQTGVRVESLVPIEKDDWDGFYRNVADHLLIGEPLAVTPESARKVIAVLSLAEQSSQQGGVPLRPGFDQ